MCAGGLSESNCQNGFIFEVSFTLRFNNKRGFAWLEAKELINPSNKIEGASGTARIYRYERVLRFADHQN